MSGSLSAVALVPCGLCEVSPYSRGFPGAFDDILKLYPDDDVERQKDLADPMKVRYGSSKS